VAQSVKPADAGISVGQVFQGKYRVDAILGHGGMGVVAECTHLALNERVAIKMLRQDVLLDQDAKARFLREAQAAVKLKSEYVARVSDVGTFENGVPYMVMEFLEGLDLGELLKQRGVMPVQWAVELMLQTAEALSEAHALGIVHRDVKPTNLFVTWRPDGSALIKVLDFGISKSAAGTDMQLTQTQSLLGTPAYMSPEQMRSARLVDTRTDIWSLGTVFYEALEGHRPFEAESFSEMCVKVAVDPPAPMRNAPAGLQQVILRCLAKAPEQRYMSMAEFARDLVPYAADPHGAQVLVDRMTRMLKRANMEWESGASSGVYRPAQPLTPVPGQWGAGSDPVGQAWHSNTPIPGSRPFGHEASQPFAPPFDDSRPHALASSTFDIKPKKSRVGVIVFGLLAVATAAVVYGVLQTGGSGAEQPAAAAPPVEMQTQQASPAPQPTAATPPPVPTPTPLPPTQATEPVTAPENVEAPVANKTGNTTTAKPGAGSKASAKTGMKTSAKTSSTKTTVIEKTTPKEAPKETTKETTKTVEPKCDPFGSMHGCEKSK
jgi:serine/threonine-protein kinase